MSDMPDRKLDRTQLLKGVLDLATLSLLKDEDGYGYDVVRRLRNNGLSEVAEASVYGTLRRLFSFGYLTSYVVPSEAGPHRKYYGMTDVGRTWLEDQRDQWVEFRTVIDQITTRSHKGEK